LQKSLCKAASTRKLTKQSAGADHQPVLTFHRQHRLFVLTFLGELCFY